MIENLAKINISVVYLGYIPLSLIPEKGPLWSERGGSRKESQNSLGVMWTGGLSPDGVFVFSFFLFFLTARVTTHPPGRDPPEPRPTPGRDPALVASFSKMLHEIASVSSYFDKICCGKKCTVRRICCQSLGRIREK